MLKLSYHSAQQREKSLNVRTWTGWARLTQNVSGSHTLAAYTVSWNVNINKDKLGCLGAPDKVTHARTATLVTIVSCARSPILSLLALLWYPCLSSWWSIRDVKRVEHCNKTTSALCFFAIYSTITNPLAWILLHSLLYSFVYYPIFNMYSFFLIILIKFMGLYTPFFTQCFW